ncbi:hypothetical protein BABINDRAFT_160667 [Babjeviella inositovora NRRL Y-12698]|uniref:4-hydroxyphenylpyruvate dioxygenase n=1 Tax=Babjeviella inositovora NRRL Y-12698 TaxID=984486 RepID=A0A1E3QUF0_9ASCO|nr:uncharacterized protein BABINDRAFT_160667 [Babjeviella inositovora NRRL Y-12698]ODQ81305.1 hypothetical protein BABINDRAFT_160667 [Babjeviella inositovora NRRL Y-12698]
MRALESQKFPSFRSFRRSKKSKGSIDVLQIHKVDGLSDPTDIHRQAPISLSKTAMLETPIVHVQSIVPAALAEFQALDLASELVLLDINSLLIAKIPEAMYSGYAYVEWYVSNAKQSAAYFQHSLGFKPVAYKGLETGSRDVCSHVVRNGDAIFVFTSALRSSAPEGSEDKETVDAIHSHITKHGDGVKDVAYYVNDAQTLFTISTEAGARVIEPPHTVQDEYGSAVIARISVFGDTVHSLVQLQDYAGPFLPGYKPPKAQQATIFDDLSPIELIRIDHCVQNQGWDKMVESCSKYSRMLGFHKFWLVDEKDVSTEFSALKSIVMASPDEVIKMPVNEPAVGKCKSQIEEFIEFYDGPGIQHVAILTDDIIATVGAMKLRGCEFISVPDAYFDNLRERLATSSTEILESMDELQRLGVLVDFDENGYLLQLFTQPLSDRPTLFLEIIQRHNHNGFGAGNFKALFETIEQEQRKRGTL